VLAGDLVKKSFSLNDTIYGIVVKTEEFTTPKTVLQEVSQTDQIWLGQMGRRICVFWQDGSIDHWPEASLTLVSHVSHTC
tara:strand:+ start:310 stop:549 length:240 start_codon:yes stop_codon:yes gene_type:complete